MDAAAVAGAVWVLTTRVEMLKNVVAGIFERLGGLHPWGFMGNILDIGDIDGRVGFMADPVNVDPAEAEDPENVNYLRPIFAATCRSRQDFFIFFARVKTSFMPILGSPSSVDITNTMGWDFFHLQLGIKHGREDEDLPPTSPTLFEPWGNGAAAQQNTDELGGAPFGELGPFNQAEFFFSDSLPASLPFFAPIAPIPDNLPASLPFFASTTPSFTLTQKGPISLTDFSVEETAGLNDECLFIITAPTRVKLRPLMLIANQMPGILSVGTWLSRPSMSKYLRLLGLAEIKQRKTQWNFGTVYRNVGDVKLQITLGHAGTTKWG
ncbi:hypothetical protein T484DRAFT_1859685 [Baffinella frigidus]|nr:hypothetical protein T484DRAFT_1859685 [Cryptophyta sp. CCMP2293]